MTIETLIQRYEAALNANDIDTILGLYDGDPIFMPQNAPAMVGRAAVRAAYEHVFATIKLDVRFTTHEIETHGDTAWARTSSAGRTRVLAADVVVEEGNNELFVFKRAAGEWKIHRYLFATNQPRA
jgi:uncharacterized protein (TIGR02246 family)